MKPSKFKLSILLTAWIFFALINPLQPINHTFEQKSCINLDTEDPNAGTDWLPAIIRQTYHPRDVIIADANNDGINEIVIANSYSEFITIFYYDSVIPGDWFPVCRTIGNLTTCVAVGDANNDGFNDIVAAGYCLDTYASSISILLWNEAHQKWDDAIVRSTGMGPFDVIVGDADNDGDNDIITANAGDSNVSIHRWNGADWTPHFTLKIGNPAYTLQPYDLSLADVDNDGDNDLITANSVNHSISIILWNQTISNWADYILIPVGTIGSSPRCVNIGDIDNDGDNDIVTGNYHHNNLSIFIWNSTAGAWNPEYLKDVPIDIFDGIKTVEIADINNDSKQDLIVFVDLSILIYQWNASLGTWNEPREMSSVWIERGTVGDADTDGDLDLVSTSVTHAVSIILWGDPPLGELELEVTDQFFSEDTFNITFFLQDESGAGVGSATLQATWNGSSVTAENIENLGVGYYRLTLSPLTVAPGDPAILLNINATAEGFAEIAYEMYLSVDPEVVDKEGTDEEPEPEPDPDPTSDPTSDPDSDPSDGSTDDGSPTISGIPSIIFLACAGISIGVYLKKIQGRRAGKGKKV